MAKVHFLGAARQVTGSMFLLETDTHKRILIDAGFSYEGEEELLERNSKFPFDPKTIDCVLLTHAHIDHSGNIPNLVKQGFEGNIICTEPTANLVEPLWEDSIAIQSYKAKRHRKKSKGKSTLNRLYSYVHVRESRNAILTLPFYQWFQIDTQTKFQFVPAGHILGAASIELEITVGDVTRKIGFSGDLGKSPSEIIVAPEPMKDLDYLVMESTYGNKHHKDKDDPKTILKRHIEKICIKNGGTLVIPAFSIGRTQSILFTLNRLFSSGEIPSVPVFTDSPLGQKGTQIHARLSGYLNREAKDFLSEKGSLFQFKELYVVEDEGDREEMQGTRGGKIIVSSAGMLEGGRIQEHVRNHIGDPHSMILIAGFCAPGTLGHDLLNGLQKIRLGKRDHLVYAAIDSTDTFSAHTDQSGLLKYAEGVVDQSPNIKQIIFVHGEEEGMEVLKEKLQSLTQIEVCIPFVKDTIELS